MYNSSHLFKWFQIFEVSTVSCFRYITSFLSLSICFILFDVDDFSSFSGEFTFTHQNRNKLTTFISHTSQYCFVITPCQFSSIIAPENNHFCISPYSCFMLMEWKRHLNGENQSDKSSQEVETCLHVKYIQRQTQHQGHHYV